MKIWKRFTEKFISLFSPKTLLEEPEPLVIESKFLQRKVFSHLYLPDNQEKNWSLLLLNDGQDEIELDLLRVHNKFSSTSMNLMIVAIHAGNRMDEYGTSQILDYKGRGKKSDDYQDFIIKELLPQLHASFPISADSNRVGIAGFSLGALSAVDIAWRYPKVFGIVGIFSGALWWRKTIFSEDDPDADRIIHEKVKDGSKRSQRFWLQAGTNDETSDRNNNGIIDAIDDTLDLKKLLEQKIPVGEKYCKYVEVKNGKHHPATWKKVIPDFLSWAFKND